MILFTDLNNLIAQRLGDEGKVYHLSSHIDGIIKEALLTFGAISGYWKELVQIETTSSASILDKQIYDILNPADLNLGTAHVNLTLTYQDIIDWIDTDLLGYSSLVSLDEIVDLITDAINLFQSKTKLVLGREIFAAAYDSPVIIGDDVLDVLSAYFIDSSGVYHSLQPSDEHAISLVNADSVLTQGRPSYYSLNNLSLNVLDIFPRPSENGQLEIIYVKGKSGVQDEDSDCLIPNNLVPYIKYKVEADIFDKDTDKDPYRVGYCLQRWNEGLTIGNNYTAILRTRLNNINKNAASFRDFDNLRYGWRNDLETSTLKVNGIALAGYNMVATNRIPINTYSILLDVIANAPITEVSIDIRDDYIPYILEYCLHIASLKDGFAALQKSMSMLENFIKISVGHNMYLQKRSITYIDLIKRSKYSIRQSRISQEDAA